MAHHGPQPLSDADTATPGGAAWPIYRLLLMVGIVALGLALVLSLLTGDGLRKLAFAYLTGYSFWLAAGLGCLFFVLITHLFRAGWCIVVRRVAENGAAALPVLAVLFIPLLLFVWANDGSLYPWADAKWQTLAAEHAHGHVADHGHDPAAAEDAAHNVHVGIADEDSEILDTTEDHRVAGAPSEGMILEFLYHEGTTDRTVKGLWLTKPFFTARWVIYFGVWTLLALWFRKVSLRQDASKDPALTRQRETWAPVSVILFAFTVTFAAFDLIMSLDPTWYSTIFGVYYFANAFTLGLAILILTHAWLQRHGLVPSVNVEHYHDLGKLLFAFVFFWGYIAYSQYVLIWYPSMPEIAYWFQLRGATTVEAAPQYGSIWAVLALVLLFGHLLIPFGYLLSRHVKRSKPLLQAAAWWMVAMVFIDLFWLIRPVLSSGLGAAENGPSLAVPYHLLSIETLLIAAAFVGIGGIALAAGVKAAATTSLVAHGDPRLHESLKLDTSAAAPMPDLH